MRWYMPPGRLPTFPSSSSVNSIADMACYPWIVPHEQHEQDINAFPNLKRWFDEIAARPGTKSAYANVDPSYSKPITDEERKILFGQTAR